MEAACFTIFAVSPVGKTEKIVKHHQGQKNKFTYSFLRRFYTSAGVARLAQVLCVSPGAGRTESCSVRPSPQELAPVRKEPMPIASARTWRRISRSSAVVSTPSRSTMRPSTTTVRTSAASTA